MGKEINFENSKVELKKHLELVKKILSLKRKIEDLKRDIKYSKLDIKQLEKIHKLKYKKQYGDLFVKQMIEGDSKIRAKIRLIEKYPELIMSHKNQINDLKVTSKEIMKRMTQSHKAIAKSQLLY